MPGAAIGRLRWRGSELAAEDEGGLQHVDDLLHLERLDEFGADLGIVEQFPADASYCVSWAPIIPHSG